MRRIALVAQDDPSETAAEWSSAMALPPVYIYTLDDPVSGEPRYVGKTTDVVRRMQQHLTPHALRAKTRKNAWLKSLLASGRRPVVSVIEECDVTNWQTLERAHIAAYRAAGCALTNGTDGGEGGLGAKHSPESIARTRAFHLGRKWGPEFSAKISAAMKGRVSPHRGRPLSPEQREKLRATMKGRSAHNKGKPMSPEQRAKLSAAMTGRVTANKGKPKSAEHRAKLSAARKGQCSPLLRAHLDRLHAAQKGTRRTRTAQCEQLPLF